VKRLWLLLLLAASPAWAASNALAVLPFKNLNADPTTDWLKLGIAETMVADLKRAGHTMVERDQVDKALAEIALQGQKLDDDSKAAKAGKLMGAATVVVGGYQKAGDQLRITARFVSVESGVVERTAKVTGKMTEVFDLQDQIVAELAKVRPPTSAAKGRAAPRRRPGTEKTVAAYKSYALALSSSSQAERVEKLQEALDLDPDFTYAADDLKALRERLNVYEQKSIKATDEAGKKLFAELQNGSIPLQERHTKAMMYLGQLMQHFRWQQVYEDSQRLYALKIEPTPYSDLREYASMYMFTALRTLKKNDLALQVGERHLKEFPSGMMSGSVQMQMRMFVEEIQRNEERKKKGAIELAKALEKSPRNEREVKNQAFERCSIACRSLLYAEADKWCGEFFDKYKEDDEVHFAPLSRYLYAVLKSDQGDFDRARGILKSIQKEYPAWAKDNPVETFLSTWPQP
jgi:TolB-like protein